MRAELVDHVIGTDPDRHRITGAVIDRIVATERCSADAAGHDEAVAWAETPPTRVNTSAVEGTGSCHH